MLSPTSYFYDLQIKTAWIKDDKQRLEEFFHLSIYNFPISTEKKWIRYCHTGHSRLIERIFQAQRLSLCWHLRCQTASGMLLINRQTLSSLSWHATVPFKLTQLAMPNRQQCDTKQAAACSLMLWAGRPLSCQTVDTEQPAARPLRLQPVLSQWLTKQPEALSLQATVHSASQPALIDTEQSELVVSLLVASRSLSQLCQIVADTEKHEQEYRIWCSQT